MLKTCWLWCVAHPLLALAILTIVCTAPSVVWYRVREALYPGVETKLLPRWARVLQSLVELLVNVPGAIRALLGTGGTPPGAPAPRDSVAPSAPRRAPTVIPLPVLLALGALAALGCGPATRAAALDLGGAPPVSGCTPRSSRCRDAVTPEVCSATTRQWEASPPCLVGCRVGPGGVYCAGRDGL